MHPFVLVGLGGFAGSVARYSLGGWLLHHTAQQRFPWSTFAVNAAGCLAIGVLAELVAKQGMLGQGARLFLFTGVLGGFTTFSAFGLETVLLLRRGDTGIAFAYAMGSVAIGVLAVWLGMKGVDWVARG
jgi:CrcB protein